MKKQEIIIQFKNAIINKDRETLGKLMPMFDQHNIKITKNYKLVNKNWGTSAEESYSIDNFHYKPFYLEVMEQPYPIAEKDIGAKFEEKEKEYCNKRFDSVAPKEISRDTYIDKLEVLPPCRWDGDAFYIAEAFTGTYHEMVTQIKEGAKTRYFAATRDVKKVSNYDFYIECVNELEKGITK